MSKTPLIIVSGASGSGKTTICREIAKRRNFYYGVSHTTRPIRPGEIPGHDYYFVDNEAFQAMVSKGEFMEWAKVYDHLYGTSKALVEGELAKGRGVILDVDTQGAASIRKIRRDATLVFIKTPSKETLISRLKKRASDSLEVLKKRIAMIEYEESHQKEYDQVITNDNLEDAVEALDRLIGDQLK